ncbi:MAG: protein-glutamate O-methyltransferase CheR [Desulfobacterales bacterium]|nr:protein-glutamate O-methyltransferase CheR [Desulfobacterales bacterium]
MNSIQLSKKQFHDLKKLVYQISGIHLHNGKEELLKSKIAKRMRITKLDFASYLHFLENDEDEVIEFIDTVTTNHSFFFRENKSLEYIVQQFSNHPERERKKFKIWCAACSTGDEAYTLAVQLKEVNLNFTILATDISHSVLNTAVKGIYRADKVRNVPSPLLHSYFQRGDGKFAGYVRVKEKIRNQIQFRKFNLINDQAPKNQFDAILCRNVMIYFDPATSESVVNKLHGAVVPGGYFAIGNAESLMGLNHKFNTIPKVASLYTK